jgi:thioredoxin 1
MNDNTIFDCSENDLVTFIEIEKRTFTLYVYTPFCGTCKLAKRMLDIFIQTYGGNTSILQVNIQYIPKFREQLQISSVPALFLFENGQIKNVTYAFHSIAELVDVLQP